MKNLKRLFCLLLAVIMVVLIVSSCAGTGEETTTTNNAITPEEQNELVVAKYDGKEIKYGEAKQWIQFLYQLNYSLVESGTYSYSDVVKFATQKMALTNLFIDVLKEKGESFTDEDLDKAVEDQKKYLDNTFDVVGTTSGSEYKGYEGWLKLYSVDEAFFREYVKFTTLEERVFQYIKGDISVERDTLYNYYLANAYDYAVVPGYVFNIAVVQAWDINNQIEIEAIKDTAKGYINDIKEGRKTFEEVVKIVKEEYSVDKGYSAMGVGISAIEDVITESSFINYPVFDDLDTYLSELYNNYLIEKEGENASSAYSKYLFEVYRAKIANIFRKNEIGLCEEPIEFPLGFVIFEFVEKRNAGWLLFDDVIDRVKDDYLENNVETYMEEYENDLLNKKSFEAMSIEIVDTKSEK